MKMKVLLLNIDSKLPNIALKKIAPRKRGRDERVVRQVGNVRVKFAGAQAAGQLLHQVSADNCPIRFIEKSAGRGHNDRVVQLIGQGLPAGEQHSPPAGPGAQVAA